MQRKKKNINSWNSRVCWYHTTLSGQQVCLYTIMLWLQAFHCWSYIKYESKSFHKRRVGKTVVYFRGFFFSPPTGNQELLGWPKISFGIWKKAQMNFLANQILLVLSNAVICVDLNCKQLWNFVETDLEENAWQWHPTPVLLPGKSHGWRSLVGCSPWGC